MFWIFTVAIVVLLILHKTGELKRLRNRFKKKEEAVPLPTAPKTLAGRMTGKVNKPEKDERIRARNVVLTRLGHAITGNDAIDNPKTTGGGVDGGIYLEGVFDITTDINGKMSGEIILHGHRALPNGHLQANRTFHCSFPGGEFKGQVDEKNQVSGVMFEAGKEADGGRDFVRGYMVGEFTNAT